MGWRRIVRKLYISFDTLSTEKPLVFCLPKDLFLPPLLSFLTYRSRADSSTLFSDYRRDEKPIITNPDNKSKLFTAIHMNYAKSTDSAIVIKNDSDI